MFWHWYDVRAKDDFNLRFEDFVCMGEAPNGAFVFQL